MHLSAPASLAGATIKTASTKTENNLLDDQQHTLVPVVTQDSTLGDGFGINPCHYDTSLIQ